MRSTQPPAEDRPRKRKIGAFHVVGTEMSSFFVFCGTCRDAKRPPRSTSSAANQRTAMLTGVPGIHAELICSVAFPAAMPVGTRKFT